MGVVHEKVALRFGIRSLSSTRQDRAHHAALPAATTGDSSPRVSERPLGDAG